MSEMNITFPGGTPSSTGIPNVRPTPPAPSMDTKTFTLAKTQSDTAKLASETTSTTVAPHQQQQSDGRKATG